MSLLKKPGRDVLRRDRHGNQPDEGEAVIGLKGSGILRHHFWGDYHATIGIKFADVASAEEAAKVLGAPWRVSGAVAVWFGNSAALDAAKETLAKHGLRVRCGHARCPSQCKDQGIDSVPHSIDVGPPFEVDVQIEAPREQLPLPFAKRSRKVSSKRA